jgi:hypothetical protein
VAQDLCVTNTVDEIPVDGVVALIRRSARMRHFLRPGASAASQVAPTPIYMGRTRLADQVSTRASFSLFSR